MPSFSLTFTDILLIGISSTLGVLSAVFIYNKKISSVLGFGISGILYILSASFELDLFYLSQISYFLFVGFINFACFLSKTFHEDERMNKLKKINYFTGILAVVAPVFVHIIYMNIGAYFNIGIIGSLCIILSFIILIIK